MTSDPHLQMFRVVVIGDTSVGKTSLINQLVNQEFSPNQPPTNGASYLCYSDTYKSKRFNLQIWDTAGQERFRSLSPIYYRSASAALVLFSAASENSFSSVNGWINDFRSIAGENTIVVIVANKCDLQKNDFKAAETLAKETGCLFAVVSAKTGEGVREMYHAMVEAIFKSGISPKVATITAVETEKPKRMKCC